MIRLGLCCTFLEAPIRFRTTTVRYASSLDPADRRSFLHTIALHNAVGLERAIDWCADHGIGAFRLTSGMVPLATHAEAGIPLDALDEHGEIRQQLTRAGERARRRDVRLSFHPDQFVVVGSPNEHSVANALAELEYQAEVATHIGAEQLTIHGGGGQGGKQAALDRLARGLHRLSSSARELVVLENDDRIFTVADLLPVCQREGHRLVYDVHHHRCNPDGLSISEATSAAAETWHPREPWVHLSSPAGGWSARNPRAHADYIRPRDLPEEWLTRDLTVDVEAKAKELAVLRLRRWLQRRPQRARTSGVRTPRP